MRYFSIHIPAGGQPQVGTKAGGSSSLGLFLAVEKRAGGRVTRRTKRIKEEKGTGAGQGRTREGLGHREGGK